MKALRWGYTYLINNVYLNMRKRLKWKSVLFPAQPILFKCTFSHSTTQGFNFENLLLVKGFF